MTLGPRIVGPLVVPKALGPQGLGLLLVTLGPQAFRPKAPRPYYKMPQANKALPKETRAPGPCVVSLTLNFFYERRALYLGPNW